MTYSTYNRTGGMMRALALILASVLIIALVWFVSYKNGCVSCSNTDSGTDKKTLNCQACPDPNEYKNQDVTNSAGEGYQIQFGTNGEDSQTQTDGEDSVNLPANQVEEPESKTVSFEVVIDGRSTRFDIDLNSLEDHTYNVSGDDGVKAVFEKGTLTDVKVTVNTDDMVKPEPEKEEEPIPPVEEPNPPVDEGNGGTSVQDGSDLGPGSANNNGTTPVETSSNDNQPIAASISFDLPAYTLLDGDTFGIDGYVLALGKDVERRNEIVAVMPDDGKTVALLCEPRTTKATIDEVKKQYPDKIVYTYTTNREFFVNLRGDSKFVLHNTQSKVNVQSGISTPEWFSYGTESITDEELNSYVAKNRIERYHVKGTKGCRVICDDIDVYRYRWIGPAKFE